MDGKLFGLDRRYLILFAVTALAIYVLVPQLGDFNGSWHLLKSPDALWVSLAIVFNALAYLAAAMTYKLLAFRRLAYGRTVLVQLAAMFVNRLLPAGIGGIGVNFMYLRRSRHSKVQAAAIVAVNNLWGFIGHALLTAAVLIIATAYGQDLSGVRLPDSLNASALLLIVAIIILSLFLGQQRYGRVIKQISGQLKAINDQKHELGLALLSSVCLTASNIACLYASAMALDVNVTFAQAVIIFTFGIALGTAAPTPGGLGGFEAGLVAGMVIYHVPSGKALAAAILYRLISYWLSLAVGAVAFVVCQRRKILFS